MGRGEAGVVVLIVTKASPGTYVLLLSHQHAVNVLIVHACFRACYYCYVSNKVFMDHCIVDTNKVGLRVPINHHFLFADLGLDEDDDEPVPLPNVNGAIMRKVSK